MGPMANSIDDQARRETPHLQWKGTWRWLAMLVFFNLALFLLLYPRGSHFLEDMLGAYLPLAQAGKGSGQGNLIHFYTRLVFPLFGHNPLPYHLTTWLLHLVNAGLLFVLVRRLTGHGPTGFAAALFFSIHPGLTGVVFITKRVDTLCAMALSLAGLLLLLSYLRRGNRLRLAGCAGCLLLGAACRLNMAGLALLSLCLCLLGAEGLKTPLRRRLQDAALLLAALLLPAALLALAASSGTDAVPKALGGTLGELADTLPCLASSGWERLLLHTSLVRSAILPLDPRPMASNLPGPVGVPWVQLPALAMLLVQLVLTIKFKALPTRFFLLWLLLAPAPFLLQTASGECGGLAMKDKYVYLLLPATCALWAMVALGLGRLARSHSGRAGWLVSALLMVSLVAPMLVGLHQRARCRDAAGEVTRQGLDGVRTALAREPSPKVLYLLLPNEVYRYQTFTGTGDLLPLAGAQITGPAPRHILLEYPTYLGHAGLNLYPHLALTLPTTGADVSIRTTWPRAVIAYRHQPTPGMEEITDRVFPRTQVQLNLRIPPGIAEPLFLGGDLAPFTPSSALDLSSPVTLDLPPGLFAYCLRDSAGRALLIRDDQPDRRPVRGQRNLLPLVNPALPLGLSTLDDHTAHRLRLLREQVLLAPIRPGPRLLLAKLLSELEFLDAAGAELEAAEALK